MERVNFFRNFKEIGGEIKGLVTKHVRARIFIFGSVVRGDYSVGLSDIDVAIVSDEFKDREKKLKLYDLLFSKYFDSPLQFHFLTEKQWKFFLNFIRDKCVEV